MELLSPVQVRNRLILVARRIVAEHTPDREGICPICGVLHCEALAAALGYLARVERPEPPLVVEIHRRAAVPSPRVPGCGLRRTTGTGPEPAAWADEVREQRSWDGTGRCPGH